MIRVRDFRRLREVVRALSTIVGIPDYENYLRHAHEQHREGDVMTREEFMRERMSARYDKPGSRCC